MLLSISLALSASFNPSLTFWFPPNDISYRKVKEPLCPEQIGGFMAPDKLSWWQPPSHWQLMACRLAPVSRPQSTAVWYTWTLCRLLPASQVSTNSLGRNVYKSKTMVIPITLVKNSIYGLPQAWVLFSLVRNSPRSLTLYLLIPLDEIHLDHRGSSI